MPSFSQETSIFQKGTTQYPRKKYKSLPEYLNFQSICFRLKYRPPQYLRPKDIFLTGHLILPLRFRFQQNRSSSQLKLLYPELFNTSNSQAKTHLRTAFSQTFFSCFQKQVFLKILQNFTGKYQCWRLFADLQAPKHIFL